jgi:hypothetical protein
MQPVGCQESSEETQGGAASVSGHAISFAAAGGARSALATCGIVNFVGLGQAVRNEGSSARTEMPTPRQRRTRGPKRDRRRALELLDTAPDGCTEAIFLAHGFKSEMLAELISAGLATARADPIVAGGRPLNVTRIRITDAGRRALAELRWP